MREKLVVIKAEWHYIKQHKFMMIVLIVVALIPTIYSVTFLRSMWNPYGEMNRLPVAVVNQDHSVNYQGKQLAVGKSLTNNLKKSGALDFKVLSSEQQAQQGLRHGKYYMVITVPKSFSKNATTLMASHPKRMQLDYTTSAGHNYTASKMTTSAAGQIKDQVDHEVTATYAKTLFSSVKKLDGGLKTAGTANGKMASGGQQLKNGNATVTKNLNKVASSSLTLAEGSKKVTNGLGQYVNGVEKAQTGNQKVTAGLTKFESAGQKLQAASNKLTSGATNLNGGVDKYVAAAGQIRNGSHQLNDGVQKLNSSVSGMGSSTAQLNSGMTAMTNGLGQLSTSSQKLSAATKQLSDSSSANTAVMQLQLNSLSKEVAGLNSNSQAVQSLNRSLADLQRAVDGLNNGNSGDSELSSKVSAAADQQKLTPAQKSAMLAAIKNSDHQKMDTTAVTSAMNAVNSAVSELTRSMPSSSTTAALSTDLTKLQAQQTAENSALMQIATGSASLTTNLESVSKSAGKLNAGTAELAKQTPALVNGVDQVANGSASLATNTTRFAQSGQPLQNGAGTLSSGMSQFNSQMPTVVSSTKQLTAGSAAVGNGLGTLAHSGQTLANGSAKITNGNQQLASGTQQLVTGSKKLGSGINQVTGGAQKLSTTLGNAAKKADVNPNNETYQQVSQPVKADHTELDKVPNNGTSMAPYMIAVSLFVGAIALNLMYNMYLPKAYPKSGFDWMLSKMSIWGPFTFLESILDFTLLCAMDGLRPLHMLSTFGVIWLWALVAMALVTLLNLVFAQIGSFLGMVLLVVQLSGSGGTYPIQLSSHFFEDIHDWLPMTYAVEGLRKTLMMYHNSAWLQAGVLFSILVGLLILMWLFYSRRYVQVSKIDFADQQQVAATQNSLTRRLARATN